VKVDCFALKSRVPRHLFVHDCQQDMIATGGDNAIPQKSKNERLRLKDFRRETIPD
jgi:hypothetical protein